MTSVDPRFVCRREGHLSSLEIKRASGMEVYSAYAKCAATKNHAVARDDR